MTSKVKSRQANEFQVSLPKALHRKHNYLVYKSKTKDIAHVCKVDPPTFVFQDKNLNYICK